jgi:hypothetical protein
MNTNSLYLTGLLSNILPSFLVISAVHHSFAGICSRHVRFKRDLSNKVQVPHIPPGTRAANSPNDGLPPEHCHSDGFISVLRASSALFFASFESDHGLRSCCRIMISSCPTAYLFVLRKAGKTFGFGSLTHLDTRRAFWHLLPRAVAVV